MRGAKTSCQRRAASAVTASEVEPGLSFCGAWKTARMISRLRGSPRVSSGISRTSCFVSVKFVWTTMRSLSQVTRSGGFSRVARYSSSWP